MRKLHQVVIVAAAAGGLSAIGAGAGTASAHNGPRVHELFRPYQECSPQTVVDANFPIGVLAVPQTWGTTCGQFNKAFNG